jgi:eukaryotic-like serine/threonine-protein kinase
MNGSADYKIAVFTEALRLTVHERAAYLERACGGDVELHRAVEALLQEYDQVGDFLEKSPNAARTKAKAEVVGAEKPGDCIGGYKLLQQIGEGGWGVVFMAEQDEPVRRTVALKLVKPGMDTKNVIARFEAERQALALMDHPNIAHVLDAGATETGRPYFVMELVRGTKITDYCDESRMPTADRLELFIQVCNAVQHAHQKGIIHRDIKPSNILVTTSTEGKPLPKVIDFGIAKATTGLRLTDKTLFTAFEMLIGTPAYMSPEQAALTTLDVDTRTDIYSLGVLLYELLTSTTPFDTGELLKSGLDEVRRVIQTEEPVRPSTRLRTMMAANLTSVSLRRQADPPKLIHDVRGDLDWIVMKALEKDRTRRYQTASSLAEDVQHYLLNEAVSARPPSAFYKLHKLVLRNKLLFVAIGIILCLLIAGLSLTSWSLAREKQARRDADTARKKAETNEQKASSEAAKNQQVMQFYKQMLRSVGPSVALGQDTKMLRKILDKTAEGLGEGLTNQPAAEADLRSMIGGVYLDLGDYDKAEAMERSVLALCRKSADGADTNVAASLVNLSVVHRTQSKFKLAEQEAREALALQTKLLGEEDIEVMKTEEQLALVISEGGDPAAAEPIYRKALMCERRLKENQPQLIMHSLNGLAVVLQKENQCPEAESLLRESLSLMRKESIGDVSARATVLFNLASVLNQENNLADSENCIRECVAIRRLILRPDHPLLENALGALVLVLNREQKWDEAESLCAELIPIRRKIFGSEDSGALKVFVVMDEMFAIQHKDAEAERAFNEMLAASSTNGQQAGRLWQHRAEHLARRAQWQQALDAAAHALAILPDDHTSYHIEAPLLVETGNRSAYEGLCGKITKHFQGATDPFLADRMAKDCLILPRPSADLKVPGELAETAVSRGKGQTSFTFFECSKALAEFRQGHWAGAVDWAQRAAANSSPYSQAEACAILAMAQYKLHRLEAARDALTQCAEIVEKKLPKPESGDLGGDWRDWIIAHALLTEAQNLFGTPRGGLNSSQPLNK